MLKEKKNQMELYAFFEEKEEMTAAGKKRVAAAAAAAKAYFDGLHDGGLGMALELWSAGLYSRKTEVSKQGRVDVYVRVRSNEKIGSYKAECKINGGRVGALYAKNAPKYIIYALALDNSTADYIMYPKIYRTADFLEALETYGALKSTNGRNPEPAIQCSSRKLWKWLEENGQDFYPGEVLEG